jgi:hypothetical protein
MGSSGGGTQTTEPPKWQRPYIQRGLEEAENQYQRDVQQFSPYQGYTDMALHGIVDQARNNPLAGNAASLANQTLTGGFLGSNPYLDQTFNQAALATQNQLASQFAGSGRNIDASQGLRSQQLNDLATQIYGGAYDAERNRQQQVLGMTPMLQQAQYGDLDRLLGVGQMGSTALDQYLGRVNGPMGSSVKTTGGGNALSGAAGGAMMGSMFGPWGALIGGGLGALGSL